MAARLRYSFDADGAIARLEVLGESAINLQPLMDQLGTLLEQSARDRIESTNVSPDGVPWPPSLRVQLNQGGRTLFDTGRLAASLTHAAYPDRAEIGSNVIYAGVQQAGATITAKNAPALFFTLADGTQVQVQSVTIPARPYLGVSADDEVEIGALVGAYFSDQLGAPR